MLFHLLQRELQRSLSAALTPIVRFLEATTVALVLIILASVTASLALIGLGAGLYLMIAPELGYAAAAFIVGLIALLIAIGLVFAGLGKLRSGR
ncbi:hypothetical protein HY375_00815 [Candidatus Berkelbacteria bacterium]|nr:hypothetical protein [Candidatus Berkelbacteria bacterium]